MTKTELAELPKEDREELEAALELVQATQTAYWDALGELEALLTTERMQYGAELDGSRDYEDMTVEDLTEEEENDACPLAGKDREA